jgi:hypothetical protein
MAPKDPADPVEPPRDPGAVMPLTDCDRDSMWEEDMSRTGGGPPAAGGGKPEGGTPGPGWPFLLLLFHKKDMLLALDDSLTDFRG